MYTIVRPGENERVMSGKLRSLNLWPCQFHANNDTSVR
jgi:hypothetical protein